MRPALLAVAAAALAAILAGAAGGAGAPSLRVTGKPQVVFDWKRDACAPNDIPDTPARALRDASGQVSLFITEQSARRSVGPSLGRLHHECRVVFASDRNPDPAAFDDREWLDGLYALDGGRTVVALVHDEYQGNTHPGRCPSGTYTKCWYNAVTLAVSRNGGRSFAHLPPPRNVVAALPDRYVPDAGTVGIFEPSNIVRSPRDGRYYAVVQEIDPHHPPQGTCVIRTRTPLVAASWRAWDGTAFALRFGDPYGGGGAVCPIVSTAEIADMNESLTWNTALHAFLLVGAASTPEPGVYWSTSTDLVHWSPRQLLLAAQLPWTVRCDGSLPIAYPAALDPASPSRSFDTTGRRFYLYYTRFDTGCTLGLRRDLLRIPVALGG